MTCSTTRQIVIGSPDSPCAGVLRAALDRAGRPVEAWLAPRDADELERIVQGGGDVEVVFSTFDDYLTTLWSGRVPLPVWHKLRIRCVLPETPLAQLPTGQVLDAWAAFTRAAARRRRMAALVLSALAMGAAALILALA